MIRPDLRKAASTKAESTTTESVIRPKQLVRIAIPAETHITPNRGIKRSSDTYKYSFIPRTIIDWNKLSERCTRATSILETFKGELCGLGVPPCDWYNESAISFLGTIFSSEVPAHYSTDTDSFHPNSHIWENS